MTANKPLHSLKHVSCDKFVEILQVDDKVQEQSCNKPEIDYLQHVCGVFGSVVRENLQITANMY